MTTFANAVDPARRALRLGDHQRDDEPYAAENAMLDLIEGALRTALSVGLGPQLRMRLERFEDLKPEPVFLMPPAAGGPLDEGESPAANVMVAEAGELGLAALLTDLRRLEKNKMGRLAHAAVASIKARTEAALSALRAERDAA